jgi:hypothetical protein
MMITRPAISLGAKPGCRPPAKAMAALSPTSQAVASASTRRYMLGAYTRSSLTLKHRTDQTSIVKVQKMPRDPSLLAKMVVDLATGEREPDPAPPKKDPKAVELGRLGGLKGGRVRADRLSKERRSEIARHAAATRWAKPRETI